MSLFLRDYLISVGTLPDVLDDNGTIIHITKFTELYDGRFDIEAAVTIQKIGGNLLKNHEGFLIPVMTTFDRNLVQALSSRRWKLQKVLVATTEVVQTRQSQYEVGTPLATSYGTSYPTLRGCAQLLPFSDAEKLICDIHGIPYDT